MKTVVISPFSNSPIRDWPLSHYKRLVGLLIQDEDVRVLVGRLGEPVGVRKDEGGARLSRRSGW